MLSSAAACYQAMKTRDARFDGRFFVGVTSTKIYCRPICRVRMPLQKNCTFHCSAAAAEQCGFRPCMKCRPELAPGWSTMDDSRILAHAAARLIEDSMGEPLDLESVASRVGITSRHLRRIFAREYGATPVAYAQTHRLLFAKRLLTDTSMTVTQVAYASGFGSLRRMNALFAERYRFSPGTLRKGATAKARQGVQPFRFTVPYRPPYQWEHMLNFFKVRAIPGLETVANGTYARVLYIKYRDANTQQPKRIVSWVSVENIHTRSSLQVNVSAAFAEVLSQVLTAVRRVFDVAACPDEIEASLGDLAIAHKGLRLPGAWDGFELAVRAILGQQVSVKAAQTIATRLTVQFGEPLATEEMALNLNRSFPSADRVAGLKVSQIAALGMPTARAQAILDLARAVASGAMDPSPRSNVDALMAQLARIRGVGTWTAQYIAMRALSWPDAWLPRDVVIQRALALPNTQAGERAARKRAEAWRPWRSYATMHLWNSM
jgi:AraC family transcriptional regulator, regulatory protein of adaptative response / DNA-3-methyladenine glycosylase II